MSAKNHHGTIYKQYVFTGYYINESKTDMLEPVPNLFLLSDNLAKKDAKNSGYLIPWKTDVNGVLRVMTKDAEGKTTSNVDTKKNTSTEKFPETLTNIREFLIPPMEIITWAISTAMNGNKDFDWTKEIGQKLKKFTKLEARSYHVSNIKFELLRKPKDEPLKEEDDTDKVYRKWYKDIAKSKELIRGVIIPKIRCVCFIFHDDFFVESEISVYINGKEYAFLNLGDNVVKKDDGTGAVGVAIYGDNKTLQAGQYRIEVKIEKVKFKSANQSQWNNNTADTLTYTIIEYARFSVRNPFCEMEIINCAPISVEETIYSQFPEHYLMLAKAAMENRLDENKFNKRLESSTEKNKEGQKEEHKDSYQPPPVKHGLNQLLDQLKTNKAKAELANNVICADASSKLTFAASGLLKKVADEKKIKLNNSIDLAFTSIQTWKEILEVKSTGSDFLEFVTSNEPTVSIRQAFINSYFTEAFYTDTPTPNIPNTSTIANPPESKFKIFTRQVPAGTRKLMNMADKLMKPVEIVASGLAVNFAAVDYSTAAGGLGVSLKEYRDMIRDYYDKTFFINRGNPAADNPTMFKQDSSYQKFQIFYDSGKHKIKEKDESVAAVIKFLRNNSDDSTKKVLIMGFTDSTDSFDKNIDLSLRRANGVRDAIVKELSKENEINLINRILTSGFGEQYAGNDKNNEEKKENNRRCDVFVGSETPTFFTPTEKYDVINYDSDKHEIKENDKSVIAAADYILQNVKDNSKIVMVMGYTDSTASDAHNLELSFKRSRGVKEAIVKRLVKELETPLKNNNKITYVDEFNPTRLADRILTLGFGEKYAGNDKGNESKKAKNRRTEIYIGVGKWNNAGCREGIRTLEKQRSVTVGKQMGLDEAELKLMLSILDATLAITAVIPVTSAGSLFIAALIEVGKGGYSLYKCASSAADDLIYDGMLKREKEIKDKLKSNEKKSAANLELITKEISYDKENQKAFVESVDLLDTDFRIRSEVISALFNLMIRAHVSVYEKRHQRDKKDIKDIKKTILDDFEETLNKYKIKEFIQNFILNDGWTFPLEATLKVNLDEYWLQAINTNAIEHNSSYNYVADFNLNKNFLLVGAEISEELAPKYLMWSPIIMYSARIAAHIHRIDHMRTSFQEKFPIHTLNSKNIYSFIDRFTPTHAGDFTKEIYEYINIYYRRRDQTEPKDWEPLHTLRESGENGKFKALSPFDQIRIIIVLKEDVTSMCTAEIQVHRSDENTDGIKYKISMRPLLKTELIETELNIDESKFVGRYGCVFEPFYQLGNETIKGLKPIWEGLYSAVKENIGIENFLVPLPFSLLFGGIQIIPDLFLSNATKDMPYYLTVNVAHSPDSYLTLFSPKNESEYKELMNINDPDNGRMLVTVDPERTHEVNEKNLSKIQKRVFEHKLSEIKKIASEIKSPKDRIKEDPTRFFRKEGDIYKIKDEGIFLNKDYLKLLTSSKKYLKLMKKDIHTSILIKTGTGGFINAHEMFEKLHPENVTRKNDFILEFPSFDWNSEVEFIVITSCSELKKDNYKDFNMSWQEIPCEMKLKYDGYFSNPDGPTYPAPNKLQYLGEAKLKITDFSLIPKFKIDFKPSPHLKRKTEFDESSKLSSLTPLSPLIEVKKLLESTNEEDKLRAIVLLNWGHNASEKPFAYQVSGYNNNRTRHVFAAHFKMNYSSLFGKSINGIRPFGKQLKAGDFYEYFVTVRSAGESGLADVRCKGYDEALLKSDDYIFKFAAPENYEDSENPWNRKNGGDSIKDGNRISVKEWIEDYPTWTETPVIRDSIKDV